MTLKNILIVTVWVLLPVMAYVSNSLCGSVSAVVENRKGTFILEDRLKVNLKI